MKRCVHRGAGCFPLWEANCIISTVGIFVVVQGIEDGWVISVKEGSAGSGGTRSAEGRP